VALPIPVTCEQCDKTYRVKDNLAGKTIRCPQCKKPLEVPAAGAPAKPPGRTSAPAVVKPRMPTPPNPASSPQETVLMPPPKPGARPAESGAKIPCPSCGQQLEVGTVTCPHCKFHLKLRRKLSISEALDDATRVKTVRADGTRIITRSEQAEMRAAQGRRVAILIRLIPLPIIALGVFIFLRIWNYAYWGDTLEEMRQRSGIKPPLRLELFHPYDVGLPFNLLIERSKIWIENPKLPGAGQGPASWAAFAAAAQLPYYAAEPFWAESRCRRVFVALREAGGTYGPQALERGAQPPRGELLIWREKPQPNQPGFLIGALLDLGANQENFIQTLESKRPEQMVRLRGKLSFVACDLSTLPASGDLYAQALRRKLTAVPDQASKTKIGHSAAADKEMYSFHPVLQVESFDLEKKEETAP